MQYATILIENTLWHRKTIKILDMTKILKVIKPFFVMEVGDTFEYDNNTD